jgi:hypothetical protein
MHRRWQRIGGVGLALAVALGIARAEPTVTYLYRLSDFSGTVAFELPRLAPDDESGEVLVAEVGTVRVFGPSGMAVHEFEHDQTERGFIIDVDCSGGRIAVLGRDGSGCQLLLSPGWKTGERRYPGAICIDGRNSSTSPTARTTACRSLRSSIE